MIQATLIKFWREILVLILVVLLGYMAYSKIKNIGAVEITKKYEQHINEQNAAVIQRIAELESNSSILIEKYNKDKVASSKQYQDILKAVKNKPLVIYQEGICSISPDFSNAYIEALNKANRK